MAKKATGMAAKPKPAARSDAEDAGEDGKKDVKEVIMKKPAGKIAKRPAAQEENGEVQKRPAAAGGGRHSKKARRFNAMDAAGTLPAVVKDAMAQLKNEQVPGNSFFKLIVITRAWY